MCHLGYFPIDFRRVSSILIGQYFRKDSVLLNWIQAGIDNYAIIGNLKWCKILDVICSSIFVYEGAWLGYQVLSSVCEFG